MVHDEANRKFVIEAEVAKSQTYSVTVSSTLEFPTDFTRTAMQTMEASFTFELTVADACETDASLESFALAGMTTFVYGEVTEQVVPSVLEATGLCGDVAY
mgnify:CR=1 FL=1